MKNAVVEEVLKSLVKVEITLTLCHVTLLYIIGLLSLMQQHVSCIFMSLLVACIDNFTHFIHLCGLIC